MFGYSRTKYKVFHFPKNLSQKVESRIEVDTKFLHLEEVTVRDWRQLRKLQGRLAVSYLKWRYGSHDTRILLAYVKGELAHVEWIVPAKKIRRRYHFITKNSYLIISCLTSSNFRGQRIYPAQLQYVLRSDIPTEVYWGLAAHDNIPSLKGIERAGGINAGEFVQRRWFWGLITKGYSK